MGKTSFERPTDDAPASRHEDDLVTWVQAQVALMRARHRSEIDALNVAEELSDAGQSDFDTQLSAMSASTQHLLKWHFQPEPRSRSREVRRREQRRRIALNT